MDNQTVRIEVGKAIRKALDESGYTDVEIFQAFQSCGTAVMIGSTLSREWRFVAGLRHSKDSATKFAKRINGTL